MQTQFTRRDWIRVLGTTATGLYLAPHGFGRPPAAPTAPVAIARCSGYGREVLPALEKMFDQLGGIQRIVRGKTVAIKINLTGMPSYRLAHAPLGFSHWVHPDVVGATVHLLSRAGACRIRLLESPWSTAQPLEEYMLQANWEPREFLSAAPRLEFVNTNYLGLAKSYSRFWVPGGGMMFQAYDLHPAYYECDVFVSLAKLKEHMTTGVTLSMKNCFGITPCTIYGDGAGEDEPSARPRGGRGMLHDGSRQPSKSSLSERDPDSPRLGGYRVPRVVADLVAARPVHLAIVDGVSTMSGAEGPWGGNRCRLVQPCVLIAGTNCVTTDAVAMAVMGYEPTADRGTPPFESCDSMLRLAEQLGVGTVDLKKIEVVGTSIEKARFDFPAIRKGAGLLQLKERHQG